MRLVACTSCHTQYDVTHVGQKTFDCRCGETVRNERLSAVDAKVLRCGSCGAILGECSERCEFCGSGIERDDLKLSLICPECFARSADESRFCTACGIAFHPEAAPLDLVELPCPLTGVLMPGRAVGGVAVNECPDCNGLWVPDDNFDELVRRAAEARRQRASQPVEVAAPRRTGANPASQAVAYRNCPVCEGFMQRRNYARSSGVIVDVCNEHGTWLDADELEEIAGFILSGGGERDSLVHQEHRAGGGGTRKEAQATAAFHSILAENSAGPYSVPPKTETSPTLRFMGSVVELLAALLRHP